MQHLRRDDVTVDVWLNDHRAPWHAWGDSSRGEPLVKARGFARTEAGFFEDAALARHLHQLAAQGEHALHEAIPELNGGWAGVVVWPNGHVLAAVDRVRSIPLFYYQNDGNVAIADSAVELARRFARPANLRGQATFLLFGYATGADTLFDGVRQIQPGEIVVYDPASDRGVDTIRYYRFYPQSLVAGSKRDYALELASVIERMFKRFRDGYNGQRIVIPLSGGMDSRLIAGMLKRMGIDNVLCFTYGSESNAEVQLSRKTAEALGYPWRCIEYTPEDCRRWSKSQAYQEFVRYGCKGVSRPNDQDSGAVLKLAEDGLCGPETIFFPGHSADMNAGSHIPRDYADLYSGRLSVLDEIIRHHARAIWYEPSKLLRSRAARDVVAQIIADAATPPGMNDNPLASCEMWNAEQRQAKYIINCVRTYEFVGSPWRTLWDYEFMDFYLGVPDELRYGQRLYLDCLKRCIFTDDLAPLAELPVAGHGPLKSLTCLRQPARPASRVAELILAAKRQARWRLLRWGRENPEFSRAEARKNTVVRLEQYGVSDGSMPFGAALEKLGVLRELAPEIQDALRPWFPIRLDSVSWVAVYAVMVLADVSRDAQS